MLHCALEADSARVEEYHHKSINRTSAKSARLHDYVVSSCVIPLRFYTAELSRRINNNEPIKRNNRTQRKLVEQQSVNRTRFRKKKHAICRTTTHDSQMQNPKLPPVEGLIARKPLP